MVEEYDDCVDDMSDIESEYTLDASDEERSVKLFDLARKKALILMASGGMGATKEVVCDVCHKSYFIPESSEHYTCPYCGGHRENIEDDDLSPISAIQETSSDLMTKYETKIRAEALMRQRKNEVWSNDAKEQHSLEQGSDGYEAYLEDLQEYNPMRPDDEMHAELEQHNEDLVTKAYDSKNENPEVSEDDAKDSAAKMNARNQQAKRAIHDRTMKEARRRALETETEDDDKRARSMKKENDFLYDPSVTADEYDDELINYIMGFSKYI